MRVTQDEIDKINARMNFLGITNRTNYMCRMAIHGYVLNIDTLPLVEISTELSRIGNNVNQIAKRANETGSIYKNDVIEISNKLNNMEEKLAEITASFLVKI